MGAITRDQFVRGIDAIQRYRAMLTAISAAMKAGGCDAPEDVGGQALVEELTRQLEERCSDPRERHYGTMIEYMLYDCGGPITLDDGRRFMTKTPEQLWTYWVASATGPFAPAALDLAPVTTDGETQA